MRYNVSIPATVAKLSKEDRKAFMALAIYENPEFRFIWFSDDVEENPFIIEIWPKGKLTPDEILHIEVHLCKVSFALFDKA